MNENVDVPRGGANLQNGALCIAGKASPLCTQTSTLFWPTSILTNMCGILSANLLGAKPCPRYLIVDSTLARQEG